MSINSLKFDIANKVRAFDLFAGIGGLKIAERFMYGHNSCCFREKLSEILGNGIKDEKEVYLPVWEEELYGLRPQRTYHVETDITKNIRLGRAVLTQAIVRYFRKLGFPVKRDFIGGIEVWIKEGSDTKSTEYHRYYLRPLFDDLYHGWQLNVSDNGVSIASNLNSCLIDTLPQNGYSVIAKHCVLPIDKIQPNLLIMADNILYPIANRSIAPMLGIETYHRVDNYKLAHKFEGAQKFVDEFINTDSFLKEVGISLSEGNHFMELPSSMISMVDPHAKELLYACDKLGFSPKYDFKKYGPCQSPEEPYTFFFICSDDNKRSCITLYNIIQFGKSCPEILTDGVHNNMGDEVSNVVDVGSPLYTYLGQRVLWEKDLSIYYNGADPISYISKTLQNKRFEAQKRYCAIIISDIRKDDPDPEKHKVYFKLKELLMKYGICSQVIYRDNITKSGFRYYIPNIAAALVGKMGGKPWSVKSLVKSNDMIIGIGASKQQGMKNPYLGSAVCFDKQGGFKSFNCCQATDTETLRSDLKQSILRFIKENGKPDRLIIHFYKKRMNKKESQIIEQMLLNCGVNCPVYVVNIVEAGNEDVIAFDDSEKDKMTVSGAYVHLRGNEYLLYNNERYNPHEKAPVLLPIKMTITKGGSESTAIPDDVAKDIITQVYQFCRLNCRGVKMQNKPITIVYSEIVARCVPFFTSGELNDYGRHHLWML